MREAKFYLFSSGNNSINYIFYGALCVFRTKADSSSGYVQIKQEIINLSRRFMQESIEDALSEHEQVANHAKHLKCGTI